MKTRTIVWVFAVIVGWAGVVVAQTGETPPPAEDSAAKSETQPPAANTATGDTGGAQPDLTREQEALARQQAAAPNPAAARRAAQRNAQQAPGTATGTSTTTTTTSTSTTDTSASTTTTTISATATGLSTGTPGTPGSTDTGSTTTASTTTGTTTTDTAGNGQTTAAPWPLYAFLAVIALALGVLTWLATRILKRLSAPTPKLEDTELGRRLNKLSLSIEGSFRLLTDRLQTQSDDVAAKLAAIPSPDALHTKLAALRQDVAKLGAAVEAVARRRAEPPPPQPAPSAADPIALEHQVLGETWKQFRANKELLTSFENAMQESAWEPLINDLTKTVPDDLKPTFEAVTAPWREHRMLVHKISLVPRLVNGDLKRLDNDAEELRRTREYANLLAGTQSSGEGALRLSFRFKSWVTDTFLPFADLYLQRFQQSQLEQRNSDLEAGARIVRQILRIAAVEPIDVTLGETPFDSTRHIGRSTTNDPRFSDGVITGVVRNGFIERGQQVIRQPEVIVNRTR